jgi:hypothetical protein
VRAAWLKDVRIEQSALKGDAGWIGAALWSARRLESRLASAGSFDPRRA